MMKLLRTSSSAPGLATSSGRAPKIAYVAPRFQSYAGGLEYHVEQLVARAAAAGAEVTVFAQDRIGDGPREEHSGTVLVRRCAPTISAERFIYSAELQRMLREEGHRFDIVHAHNYHALPALCAALAPTNCFVFTPHYLGTGGLGRILHAPYRPVGQRIIDSADWVICVSHTEAELLHQQFPRLSTPISIVLNGVDRDPALVPYQQPGFVILSAGRLEGYKGVEVLLRAHAQLDDRFSLRILGEGSARAQLERLASQLGAADRVSFLGRVDHRTVARWMKTAHVLVSMSRKEAFGLTVAEGLASGARVIASDIPAHAELVHGASAGAGALADVHASPNALAELIMRCAQLGRLQSPVTSIPTWDEVWEQTLAVYHDALGLRQTQVAA